MWITLRGIKRRGLDACKKAQQFRGRTVRIWSAEHRQWWRPERAGYTSDRDRAGLYDFDEAYAATRHCGPEKHIAYELAQ